LRNAAPCLIQYGGETVTSQALPDLRWTRPEPTRSMTRTPRSGTSKAGLRDTRLGPRCSAPSSASTGLRSAQYAWGDGEHPAHYALIPMSVMPVPDRVCCSRGQRRSVRMIG
jgi:hypothetical protein